MIDSSAKKVLMRGSLSRPGAIHKLQILWAIAALLVVFFIMTLFTSRPLFENSMTYFGAAAISLAVLCAWLTIWSKIRYELFQTSQDEMYLEIHDKKEKKIFRFPCIYECYWNWLSIPSKYVPASIPVLYLCVRNNTNDTTLVLAENLSVIDKPSSDWIYEENLTLDPNTVYVQYWFHRMDLRAMKRIFDSLKLEKRKYL